MSALKLHGITWDHPRAYHPLEACSSRYLKEHGIDVHWDRRSLTAFGDQSIQSLSQKYDLLLIDHPHVGTAYHSECLISFDEYLNAGEINSIQEDSIGQVFESYQYKGHQWALPIDSASQCACYRPNIIDFDVPSNWAEVFDHCEKLKRKELYLAIPLCPTDCLCTFLSLTAQLNHPIKEENEYFTDSQTAKEVYEMMSYMKNHFHPQSMNWNPIQLYDYMCDFDDVVYAPLAFGYTNYSRNGFRNKLLAFANVPQTNNAVLGGAGIAVSSKSSNIQDATKFASWICSSNIQSTTYVREGGQPASKTAWANEEGNDLTSGFFNNTIETLQNAYMRPRYCGWPEFQTYLGEKIHECLINNGDWNKVYNDLQIAFDQSKKKLLMIIYAGSYTKMITPDFGGHGEGLYCFDFDVNTGSLKKLFSQQIVNPSYLTLYKEKYLFTFNEVAEDESPFVISYRINNDYSLQKINEQPVPGSYPCHIHFSPKHQLLFITCYGSGNVAMYPVPDNGNIWPLKQLVQHKGKSVNAERQQGPHTHFTTTVENDHVALVTDLGTDSLIVYDLNPFDNNQMILRQQLRIKPGNGPRHMSFSPNGKYLFLLNELSGTINLFSYINLSIQFISEVSTGLKTSASGAAIKISLCGKFLYSSDRNSNSLSVFSFNETTQHLQLIKNVSTHGRTPRDFAITPCGNWILVAHQDSDSIAVFHIDKTTGIPTLSQVHQHIKSPVCLQFL